MKYFFDTEFIESSERKTIDLISIGIVAEDGRKYYAISTEFDASLASEWVKENVLSKLPPRPESFNPVEESPRQISESKTWKSRETIKFDIVKFVNEHEEEDSPRRFWAKHFTPIEFWAAWAAYDWVVFCWIFGDMIDLPKGFPYYCNDVIQWMNQLGMTREFLPPDPENAHNALADAQWVKEAHNALKQYVDNQNRR